jgi:hypothetical protein
MPCKRAIGFAFNAANFRWINIDGAINSGDTTIAARAAPRRSRIDGEGSAAQNNLDINRDLSVMVMIFDVLSSSAGLCQFGRDTRTDEALIHAPQQSHRRLAHFMSASS